MTERPSDWVLAGNSSGNYLYWLEPAGPRHEATAVELADWCDQLTEMRRVASACRAERSRSLETWEAEGGSVGGRNH